jgi:single-strand DNA-binding protein
MYDTIAITGNLADDPVLKHTNAGLTIASFRVGSGQRRFDHTANAWVDGETNWYAVSAFRSLAEHAHASLKRGDRVVVTGRLRVRNWENGTKRGTSVEIDAESIGHDLLWGTSTFTKTPRASAPAAETSWEAPDARDEWATPGTEHSPDDPSDAEEPRPLALVGAEPPF